ncbi:MarR family transcriptional regulator [Acrocarpospora macrocephala]|uniref:Putative HTH-type transcriptional regulator MarR n=2 Tax=Acrocarpospora TaxID=90974 RepID=A0A5M3XYZ7_9ACTN|nr:MULTISPECIES: MarR family transcriptional regulator [Acrocarpospora]GES06736.1 putative HTH-type transcriptional regulator MarR [Acrocarpospora macrocephala]GES24683.1 putative HTH-type transcriptional regulator MarR [Acrocarpospora pleiomorpha]
MIPANEQNPVSPADLDFWSFVALANRKLATEYGFAHQLATQVLITLNRASDLVTYDLEASVHRPRGRSWSAFRLLFVIWLAGPMEPSTAARLTGMSRAAVSNLTKTLIGDGLLARTAAERDGRSVTLSLTDAGQAEMVDVFREHNEREFEWADALTEAEQRTLISLLDKLITAERAIEVRGRA